MREQLRDPGRLSHILMAIDNVHNFLDGKSFDDFCSDKILFFALVKNLEIIGEAANCITKEFRLQHPEVEWPVIIGMRHVLVHDYYNIDAKTAWQTAKENIPVLRPQIEALLEQLK